MAAIVAAVVDRRRGYNPATIDWRSRDSTGFEAGEPPISVKQPTMLPSMLFRQKNEHKHSQFELSMPEQPYLSGFDEEERWRTQRESGGEKGGGEPH